MSQSLSPILPLLFALPVILFWLWMFRDMTLNDRLPPEMKNYWVMAFIFLSLITAAYYFVTEYRPNR